MCIMHLHAGTYQSINAKNVVNIHWTLLGNFYSLHHLQILQCLNAIAKYKTLEYQGTMCPSF